MSRHEDPSRQRDVARSASIRVAAPPCFGNTLIVWRSFEQVVESHNEVCDEVGQTPDQHVGCLVTDHAGRYQQRDPIRPPRAVSRRRPVPARSPAAAAT